MKRCTITRSTIADKCQIRFQRSVSRLTRWIIVSIGLGAVVALALLLSTTGGRWSAAFWRRSCSFRFIYSSIELKSVWLSSSSSIVSCTYWLLVCIFCLLDRLLVFLLVVGCCICAISRWVCIAYIVLSRHLFLRIHLSAKISCMISRIDFCILIDLTLSQFSFMDDRRRNLICSAESMPWADWILVKWNRKLQSLDRFLSHPCWQTILYESFVESSHRRRLVKICPRGMQQSYSGFE